MVLKGSYYSLIQGTSNECSNFHARLNFHRNQARNPWKLYPFENNGSGNEYGHNDLEGISNDTSWPIRYLYPERQPIAAKNGTINLKFRISIFIDTKLGK